MKHNESSEKKKKFKLFDMNRDGKGVYEHEDRKPTLKFFFKLIRRKFSQLLQLNLLMLFQVIPLLVILGLYLMGTKTQSATSTLYAPLYGISKILPSAEIVTKLDLAGIQMELPVFSTGVNITILCLLIFLAVTFGWQNTGSAYVLRGLFRGDAVFVFSDYFYGIKRNMKQAFFLGLLDFVCCAVLVIDFIFFYFRTGSFGADFMYFAIFALGLIYIAMRFYLYQLLVTFDLSNFKILKNALIFSILGIKRNLMAFLGLIVVYGLNFLLILLTVPRGFSLFVVLPLVYIMALTGFTATYAAYPVIDRYMIAPYAKPEAQAEEEPDTGDAGEN